MRVLDYLINESSKFPVHLTLIDPEKQEINEAAKMASHASKGGTKGIMVGGSTIAQDKLDSTVIAIKRAVKLPVIIFPSDITSISRHADAIFFMSLLNSRNPYYITGAQALGAPLVKKGGIEVIPMGYIIVEPGGVAGKVGEAQLIPRNRPDLATNYALAAQFLGMKLVYLEAGSGAERYVTEDMVSMVKKAIDIPLIVGGGIKTGKDAREVAKAGADIIVTGTIVEKVSNVEEKIRELTDSLKGVKR